MKKKAFTLPPSALIAIIAAILLAIVFGLIVTGQMRKIFMPE